MEFKAINNPAASANRRFGGVCCFGKVFVSGFNTVLTAPRLSHVAGSWVLNPSNTINLFAISIFMLVMIVSYPSWSFLLFFIFVSYFELIKNFKPLKQFFVVLANIFLATIIIFANVFFINNVLLFFSAATYYSFLLGFEVYFIGKLLGKRFSLFYIFMACVLYRLPLCHSTYIIPFYWTLSMQLHPLMNIISKFMLPLFFEAACICISIIIYKLYLRSITIIHLAQLVVILSFCVTASVLYKNHTQYNQTNDSSFECTIIQGGFSAFDYRLMEKYPDLIEKSTEIYINHIEDNYNDNLLILPESAFFTKHGFDSPVLLKLKEIAKKNNANIYASVLLEENGKVFNSVALIKNTGEITDTYNKTNPMYFIETDSIEKGNNINLFTLNGYKIAPLICFDVVFLRNFFREHTPDIYIVTSNDVFAENTILSKLHQAYAVINARTVSKPLLQVVQNGPSFYINKNGELNYISEQFQIIKGMKIKIE